MATLGSKRSALAAVMLTVVLGLSSTGEGHKQELWLFTEKGNALYFHTHEPDLTKYSAILPEITSHCAMGVWLTSSEVNFQKLEKILGHGTENLTCAEFNATRVKSLRYWAAEDTLTDAISLYIGENFTGDEMYVSERAKTDITTPISSLVATGTSSWMIYEGLDLDGVSTCYRVPLGEYDFNWTYRVKDLNLTKIGSIFKGCDLDEIQLYRETYLF